MKSLEHYLTTKETPTGSAAELRYWVNLTIKTRAHGSCYVHAGMRGIDYTHDGHPSGYIVFVWGSYGRSLAGGGHKYKVHARYTQTGKPVPTKVLKFL